MDLTILSQIDILPVTIAALAYFACGMLWFGVIFKSWWNQELTNHGVHVEQPSISTMIQKSIRTLINNFITCFGLAIIVMASGLTGFYSGVMLGAFISMVFVATTLDTIAVWEKRPVSLWFIDTFYPVIGIMLATGILCMWH